MDNNFIILVVILIAVCLIANYSGESKGETEQDKELAERLENQRQESIRAKEEKAQRKAEELAERLEAKKREQKEARNFMLNHIAIDNIDDTLFVTSTDRTKVLSVNFKARRLRIVFDDAKEILELPFKDILSFDVITDATKKREGSTKSAIVRGAVGGIALGPLGMAAGAISGASDKKKHATFYNIRIVTIDNNILEYRMIDEEACFKGWGPDEKTLLQINRGMESAIEAEDVIRNKTVNHQLAPAVEGDPLEKLERLASLRDKGILTEEEFQDQKKKLLG